MEEKKLLNEEELETASGTAAAADASGRIINEPTAAALAASEYRYDEYKYVHREKNAFPFKRDEYSSGKPIGLLLGETAKVLDDSAVAGVTAGTAGQVYDEKAKGLSYNPENVHIIGRMVEPERVIMSTSEGFAEGADDDAASYGKRASFGVILIT